MTNTKKLAIPSNTLLGVLVRLDRKAMARVWVDCNRFKWPDDLPVKFKPHWWDGVKYLSDHEIRDRRLGFIGVVMDYIGAIVPKSELGDEWRRRAAFPVECEVAG